MIVAIVVFVLAMLMLKAEDSGKRGISSMLFVVMFVFVIMCGGGS
ncbi:unnamed protein product [marine sediment metagenome]|uniref:Uncharacterized protein n=1 Tax=marine sediment metagenome TaxID=412755 RepID=X0TN28_9ZZZZ